MPGSRPASLDMWLLWIASIHNINQRVVNINELLAIDIHALKTSRTEQKRGENQQTRKENRESQKNAGKRQQRFLNFQSFCLGFLHLIEKLCSAHSFVGLIISFSLFCYVYFVYSAKFHFSINERC